MLIIPFRHVHVVQVGAILHLILRFGDVGVQGHIVLFGQIHTGTEQFRGGGVPRMGRNGWLNQLMPVPPFDKAAATRQRIFIGAGIGGGEHEHGLAEQGTETDSGRFLGHRLFKIVHIGKTGHTRANEFGAPQFGSQPHPRLVHKLPFDGHQVAQPHVQPQVVVQATHQSHGQMGVGVDEAGHDNVVWVVVALGGGKTAAQLVGWPHRDNIASAHGHAAIGNQLKFGVHGHNHRGREEGINGFFHKLGG